MNPLVERVRELRHRLGRERGGGEALRADRLAPVHPRVLMVVNDPPIPAEGGRRLTEVFRWNDPERLAAGCIDDLRACSGGYLRYEIVGRIDSDDWPPRTDGFRYDADSFIEDWRARRPRRTYQLTIDYPERIRQFDLEGRLRRDEFDEVWFFSFPYSGDYESSMAGPGAFWCNAPPVHGTSHHRKRWVIMAFNYERDVDCMLENFGHRVESIMKQVYHRHGEGRNMWRRFIRHEKTNPGRSECGNVHFAPNSERDYDWGNRRPVLSYCDDWLTYPALPRRIREVDCSEWGNGDMRLHHLWWLSHLPRGAGETEGVSDNWWRYVADPNLAP